MRKLSCRPVEPRGEAHDVRKSGDFRGETWFLHDVPLEQVPDSVHLAASRDDAEESEDDDWD